MTDTEANFRTIEHISYTYDSIGGKNMEHRLKVRLACYIALLSKGDDMSLLQHEECLNVISMKMYGQKMFNRCSLSRFINATRNYSIRCLEILSIYTSVDIQTLNEIYYREKPRSRDSITGAQIIDRGVGAYSFGLNGSIIKDYELIKNAYNPIDLPDILEWGKKTDYFSNKTNNSNTPTS